MTLVELLVVIIILTTIVAAAIPLMTPTNNERRLREASRGLNTFITAAQARAVQLQRPYGIALKKLSKDTGRSDPADLLNDNGVCLEVYYVQQPPPFTGFDERSCARVSSHVPADDDWYGGVQPLVLIQFLVHAAKWPQATDHLPPGLDADPLFPDGVVRPHDVIEINGHRYELLADSDDTDTVARLDDSGTYFTSDTGKINTGDSTVPTRIVARPLDSTDDAVLVKYVRFDDHGNELSREFANAPTNHNWPYPSSYKVLRQPAPVSRPPHQLPEGTAIDLRGSGVMLEIPATYYVGLDVNGFFHKPLIPASGGLEIDNSDPVVIMFSPEGSISRLRVSNFPYDGDEDPYFDEPITSNVFLLVGSREKIPPAETGDLADDVTLEPTDIPSLTDEELAEARAKVNWLSPDSRWVVIGARSGRVVTAENTFVDLRSWSSTANTTPEAVEFRAGDALLRRALQIDAARDYAREMTPLGGR